MSEQRVIRGDSFDVLPTLEDASVHAVVTDPPYGLEFMGAVWDAPWRGIVMDPASVGGFQDGGGGNPHSRARIRYLAGGGETGRALQEWNARWLAECYRVLKPGGLIVAFSGTRTYHRLACAAEDVGFEVRDMLEWLYGSGYPKSFNVANAINERVGAREVVGQKWAERYPNGPGGSSFGVGDDPDGTRSAERSVALEPHAAVRSRYGDARCRCLDTGDGGAAGDDVGREGWNPASSARGGDHRGAVLDPDRRDPRRAVSDDQLGWSVAITRCCSWCGLPDEQFLEYVAGAGTALKPAHEPILLARKPLEGTVAENVLRHGAGGLNVAATLVGTSKEVPASPRRAEQGAAYGDLGNARGDEQGFDPDVGRWPANLLLSHGDGCGEECAPGCPVALLDEQTGVLTSGLMRAGTRRTQDGGYSGGFPEVAAGRDTYGDSGGASRFFYTAKASRAEREAGLDDLDEVSFGMSSGAQAAIARGEDAYQGEDSSTGLNRVKRVRNDHPTVKPIAVMRWLLRLVVPPGGVALDPFLGSGTTAVAAALEDVELVGIEKEPAFAAIAGARLAFWREHGEDGFELAARAQAGRRRRREAEDAGQLDLFAG